MQVQQQKNGRRKPERASPMADKSDVPWKSSPSVPLRLHSCEALKVCRSPTELSVKNPYETLQVRFCRPGFHRTAAIFWLGCKKEVWSRLVDLSDFFFFFWLYWKILLFLWESEEPASLRTTRNPCCCSVLMSQFQLVWALKRVLILCWC